VAIFTRIALVRKYNAGLSFALFLPCPAALPGSLARQPCPAALPGSLAHLLFPATLPCSLARQPCPAALPANLAEKFASFFTAVGRMHAALHTFTRLAWQFSSSFTRN
jgi:hypothetical protein